MIAQALIDPHDADTARRDEDADRDPAAVGQRKADAEARDGWKARLDLRFARSGPRTVLVERRHSGPLRVQKALYPEGPGVCQAIIVHPPGGIVGGDTLEIDIDARDGAHVQVTTPGAAKWYRSTGAHAHSRTRLHVGDGALVEWLPQENLLFNGARAAIDLRVELNAGGRFIGWDVTTLGRTASGEAFLKGRLRQAWELVRDDALLWCERCVIGGGSRQLHSSAMLDGAPVFGTLVAAGLRVDDDLLAACRNGPGAAESGAVTRMPDAFVARYRGDSAHAARAYFVTLWKLLRPAFAGRVAAPPRIWST